jgi:hypothetical protein
MTTVAPEQLKACCAAAYSSEAARWLFGDSLHPGGAALTARLGAALDVGPGDLAVDVASGLGTSAVQLARETGCDVVGVDLSSESVVHATAAAEREGLSSQVRFLEGDAEALPLPDGVAEGALCECALCTFPDKERAAAEVHRVLRPGGRLALSDVTAERDQLPEALRSTTAWTACVAGASRLQGIIALLERAGFVVEAAESHDEALGAMIERVDGRLRGVRLLTGPLFAAPVEQALALLDAARRAHQAGTLGYGAVVARRR